MPTTPKPKPDRTPRSLRLGQPGIDAIQSIADRDGISWMEAARRLLRYGVQKMPKGWH